MPPNNNSGRRLLIVTESLGVGGTESHLIRTLPRIAASGWNVVTFCLTEPGERAGQVEKAGVEVCASPRLAKRKGSVLRYPAHVGLATNKLYWLMRRWRPDIAHFYLPGPYLIGAHVAIAARSARSTRGSSSISICKSATRPRRFSSLKASSRASRLNSYAAHRYDAPMAPNRKLIGFDPETLQALELLSRDSGKDLQALADEAFADLLVKHQRPRTLKDALKQSASASPPTRTDRRSGEGPRASNARGIYNPCPGAELQTQPKIAPCKDLQRRYVTQEHRLTDGVTSPFSGYGVYGYRWHRKPLIAYASAPGRSRLRHNRFLPNRTRRRCLILRENRHQRCRARP